MRSHFEFTWLESIGKEECEVAFHSTISNS